MLSVIRRCAEDAGTVVHRVLGYSRTDGQERRTINIAEAVNQSVQMVTRALPPFVNLYANIIESDATAEISTVEMTQVMTNLLMNATKATEGLGGKNKIEIRGQPIVVGDEAVFRITVADNGYGMDKETLCRAFNPFFTTRAEDGGTGLGLAIVRNLVNEWGGNVRIVSSPGDGCTVTITVPISLTQSGKENADDSDRG